MEKLEIDYIKQFLKKRLLNSHKGDFGHALLIAGSVQKVGAAIIAAKACLRSGAGLLTVSIPKEERSSIFTSIPEAMLHFREEQIDFSKYNSLAIGPGLEQDAAAQKLLYSTLSKTKYPIVIDADALNILSSNQDWLTLLPKDSILTPHPKEFDRLFGLHNSKEDRIQTAIQKANEYNCIIVLKGHQSVITNGHRTFVNTSGNAGLAKGGSGDALTGIILAFLAQNYEPINAAKLAVFTHGLSADITLQTQSEESMLITDVIENLGKAFQKIKAEIK
ncbi:NAD(P)H-hydrate dehydratase [Flavobacterium sp.]|jgi:NAD(P)H-hydrate epimerase|uniref:NAD(P)H-hydrate dehydratase n=1 Tax=Flavobacterium sp. TaxID=239 RepID=UPI002A830231|nr:NAD(P)H-hydrate dehydratase [Flavobacterium sp.]